MYSCCTVHPRSLLALTSTCDENFLLVLMMAKRRKSEHLIFELASRLFIGYDWPVCDVGKLEDGHLNWHLI